MKFRKVLESYLSGEPKPVWKILYRNNETGEEETTGELHTLARRNSMVRSFEASNKYTIIKVFNVYDPDDIYIP